MHQLSDEALMAAVMAGDRAALAALVERHHHLLLGYLYRLVGGDRPLAEDLCQETFTRLLRQRDYQSERPFKPWLYAIATNLVRDHRTSAAVTSNVSQDKGGELLLALPDRTPGPEEQALAAEQGRDVASAFATLNDEYRITVLLRFYHGFSLQEIAATLHIPLGTVKSRLAVGTRRLRDRLAPLREGGE